MGAARHAVNRARDHSVEGLMGLAPDRIHWRERVVIEAKGGGGAVEAVSRQTAYYALMLWAASGEPWRAQNDILSTRRVRSVVIDEAMTSEMLGLAAKLADLKTRQTAPDAEKKPICSSCSYRFLCGY